MARKLPIKQMIETTMHNMGNYMIYTSPPGKEITKLYIYLY